MKEKLQVSEPPENGGHPKERQAANDQQTANRFAFTIRIDRLAVTLGIYRSADTYGCVGTVILHGEIRTIRAPPGSSFA
jgi:hypothetical protein